MRTKTMGTMGTMAGLFGAMALVGCSMPAIGMGNVSEGAIGSPANGDDVEVADRLFEGTVSNSDASNGVCTFVVRPSGDVEALIATAKGEVRYVGTMTNGRFDLQPAASTPSAAPAPSAPAACMVYPKSGAAYCTNPSNVLCGEGHCCPSDRPYGCASTGECYASSETAAAKCGTSCVACGAAPASGGSAPPSSGSSSGSGPVTGNVSGDAISGRYEDGSGKGGVFTAQDATKKPVQRYCGTFSGSDHGTWNWQATDTRASGSFQGEEASGVLNGSVSGSTVTLAFSGAFVSGTARGSIGGTSVSGTWKTSDGQYSGSWTGRAGACAGASGGSSTSSGSSSSPPASKGCCTTVERNGKKMTACCIEGCRADGSCASASGR